jgi:ferredoxin--NADP+ reductase
VIGRRGPAQAKFTTKELRELGQLTGVDIAVPGAEADLAAFDAYGEGDKLVESDRRVRGNLAVIGDWAARCPDFSARQISDRWLNVRFWLRPVRIEGNGRVSGLVVERTRLDENGKLTGTGEYERMDVQMVLRSVGYQSVPLPGVPFDERTYTVPNEAGRVTGPDGAPLPREYVVGWLKRGPTGVIGTNKSDAAQTVRSLLADLAGGPGPDDVQLPRPGLLRYPETELVRPDGSRSSFEELLAARGIRPVSYADWQKIETAEKELAAALRRGTRVKLGSREEIHRACGLDTPG